MLKQAILVLVMTALAGCVSFSDGPYRDYYGSEIDAEVLSDLARRHATPEAVRAVLGEPAHVAKDAQGVDYWEYTHVKRRISRAQWPIVAVDTCGYGRVTHTLRFDDRGVVSYERAPSHWTTTSRDDKTCWKAE